MVSPLPKTFRPPLSQITEYDLRAAILHTLAYSDIFDFPLTAKEIHRYLIGYKAELGEIEAALRELGTSIISQGELFALPGRAEVFGLRHKRSETSKALWRDAIRYGRWICGLPFVRMAALTGALVSDNVEAGADLDFFIITEPGWLWTTRAMILALDRAAARSGTRARLCPNYLITSSALELPEQDLFTAQEMARMVPVGGIELYRKFRQANSWAESFLPNAAGYPREFANESPDGRTRLVVEKVFNNPVARRLEKWEMQRKIRKFSNMAGENNETRFSADLCKGHFDGHKRRTLEAFEDKVRAQRLSK